jgi:hypothetical protein
MQDIILWTLFVIPWLSLVFINRSDLRRYMPVALFVTVINTLIYQVAYYYNWWREVGLFEWDKIASISWVYSAYLVATIWIFRFTYGKFWLYFIINLLLDGIYVFVWYPIQRNLGMASGEMARFNVYLIMTCVSLVIYLYQKSGQDAEVLN